MTIIQHEGLITAQNLFPLYLPNFTDRHIEKIKNFFRKHVDFSEKSNFDAELAMQARGGNTRWSQSQNNGSNA